MAPETRRSKQTKPQGLSPREEAIQQARPGFPTSNSQVQEIVDGEVELSPAQVAEPSNTSHRPEEAGRSRSMSQGHIRKSKSGLGEQFFF